MPTPHPTRNPIRLATLVAGLAAATGCTSSRTAPDAAPNVFGPPQVWAEPITDYLAVGEERFPDGFFRAINDLAVAGGEGDDGGMTDRLWIGYGDATRNMGTAMPIEFRFFAAPDDPEARIARVIAGPPEMPSAQGAPQRTPGDTGEEHLGFFRLVTSDTGTHLWQPGIDSNDPDEAWTQAKPAPERLIEGNVLRLEQLGGEPAWVKFRSIPGGEHVHDVAQFDGSLWAVGSGSDHRGEWESGRIFRYLWRSEDGGASFTTAHRVMYPELGKGDTRFRQLLPIGDTLHVFGYVNPFVDGGPLQGRHITVRGGVIRDLEGPFARQVVDRAWPLSGTLGLLVTREAEGTPSRAFAVDPRGIHELAGLDALRILDVTPGERPGEVLVLAAGREDPAAQAVHRLAFDALDRPQPVLDLPGVAAASIALWRGDLYIGTEDGRVLRSRRGR
jgi:hypothetical protein